MLLGSPASPARADEPSEVRLPLALAQRPLTLPRLVLAPRLQLDLTHNAAGMAEALTIYDLGNVSNTTGIPLGVSGGYALGGPSGPIIDICDTERRVVSAAPLNFVRGTRNERYPPSSALASWLPTAASPASPAPASHGCSFVQSAKGTFSR